MSTMKAFCFPACRATPKTTGPPNLILSNPSKNLHFLTVFPSNNSLISTPIAKTLNPRKSNTLTFLTLCSTKPQIDNGNSSLDDPPKPTSIELQFSSPSTSTKGLVFDLGQNGSWDSTEIGSPVVKRFLSDDEERWYMWYYGRSEKNSGSDWVGLAVSSNGVHWQRDQEATNSSTGSGLVMKCGSDWWAFDTKSIRPSEVMVMSSNKVRVSSAVYWLYYTGYTPEEVELPENFALKFPLQNPEMAHFDAKNGESLGFGRVLKSLPGLAISQDGRNWARIEGDHHSGALFDVGSNGEWDSLFIGCPHVVFHSNGDLRMYYHSFDPQNGEFAIGIARSRDGINWVKLGKIMGGGLNGCYDEMGVVNACVVKNKKDGSYLMAYESVAKDRKRCISLAISPDGLKDWRRICDGPTLMPSMADGWDSEGVGFPCLVQMDGEEDKWRLYYRGVGVGGRTGIGLAVSQASDFRSFKRWEGFYL